MKHDWDSYLSHLLLQIKRRDVKEFIKRKLFWNSINKWFLCHSLLVPTFLMVRPVLVLSPHKDHTAHISRVASHFYSVSLPLWDQTSLWNCMVAVATAHVSFNMDVILINICTFKKCTPHKQHTHMHIIHRQSLPWEKLHHLLIEVKCP